MTQALDAGPGPDGAGAAGPGPAAGARGALSWRAVIWLAFALRLAVFPFTENKQADAPMRALLAERMNGDPTAAADPRSFCQFGPLPIEVMRPFLAVDPDARRSSRVPAFLAGMLAFVPFLALGRRLVGGTPAAVGLAALALALSPLHIQLSTTASSEALYLPLWLAMLERLHAALSDRRRRDFVLAGVLGSLAAVTRFDSWIALPVAAAAVVVFARDRRARAALDAGVFLAIAGVLPALYLLWSWAKTGDPFFFARYIANDHATAARETVAHLGGGLARVRQVGIWVVSFAAAMTPLMLVASVPALRGWRRWPAATRAVVAITLAPIALYLGRGLVLGAFEPLARFALAPGAVLLPLAAQALSATAGGGEPRWRPHTVVAVAAGALSLWAVAVALTFGGQGRIWTGAESISPITRLDAEDRALARFLLQHRDPHEGIFVDTFGFADIIIAHAARAPAPRVATLSQTRELGPSLGDARSRSGASWFALHDQSWGRAAIPDWPAETRRFGHWRLAHVGYDGGNPAGP